jgi:predicted lipid-binding transport protein (Tim44 family)
MKNYKNSGGKNTMFKKLLVVMMASMLVFSVTAPNLVDAKKSYSSTKKNFAPTQPQKAPNNNVTSNQPGSPTSKAPGAATPAAKPGFFSGGLMKGLLIGGIAGMLFGGLFGGMGALGNILGLLVNVLAIVVLFVVIKKIVSYFIQRRKMNQEQKRY